VRTSAGGETITGPSGEYWLEVSLPATTRSLRVSSERDHVGQRKSATTRVALAPGGGVHPLADLHLSAGCTPGWVATFGARPGTGTSGDDVDALCVFDDGSGSGPELYAGGLFTVMNGLPPGTRVAHKTGDITGTAIVFPPDRGPYVLVILTRGYDDHADADRAARPSREPCTRA